MNNKFIEKYLKEECSKYDWKYTVDEEENAFFIFPMLNSKISDNKIRECTVRIYEKEEELQVNTDFSIIPLENVRPQVEELMEYINEGDMAGRFYLDADKGYITYSFCLKYKGIQDIDTLNGLLDLGRIFLSMYEDVLLDVIFGKMTAKEAYESRMGDKGRTTEERMLYREKMCEAVEQYLKKEKMFYWYDKENCTFSSKTEMEGMIRCCDILIMIDEDTICTKTYLPVQADMDARETVDELLIRINEKLGLERFKMDYDSGEVWHEAFFFYDGEKLPSEKRMDEIFWTGVSRIRVFGEILMSAMLGYVDSVDKVLQEVMDNIAE